MEEILAALERIAAEKGTEPAEWKAAVAATQAKADAKTSAKPLGKKKRGCLPWVLGILGLLLLFGLFRGCAPERSGSVMQYVNRPVNVRETPSTKQPSVAKLERGVEVTGEWVVGQDGETQWFKIIDGPNRGEFVWGRNLSERPRPTLSRITGARVRARSAGSIHQEPDLTTPKVARVAAGEALTTVGTTADGWTEVALSKGGVGYVQSSLLGRAGGRSQTRR